MALVRYNVAWNGFLTGYASPTGLVNPITGLQELGGGLNEGDYCDFTQSEARALSSQLNEGRYRFVRVLIAATAANTFRGAVAGIAPLGVVTGITILTLGSGQTAGTYTITATGGTFTTAAVAQVVIGAAGTVISASILNGGVYTTATAPTFTIPTSVGGTQGTLQAQLGISSNVVTTFDSSALNVLQARGTFLFALTAAQIAAQAYCFIQESGVASVYITTATSAASGAKVWAQTASGTTTVATSNVPTASYAAELGQALDAPTAGALCRVQLTLPIRQG